MTVTPVLDLPASLHAKTDPALVGPDEEHLAAVAATLDGAIADLSARLDAARRTAVRHGQAALDRDEEVHRLAARLRTLRRAGQDLCLGRMVPADGSEPVYVGRFGLTDAAGRRLLVDWRSPAAEPFFGATHGDPMGLASRRRYRWTRGRVTDYWDEVFTPDGLTGHAALDDTSAFIASLGTSRTARMRDVLGTIQADQDAVVRAGSRGALVVDGGPGTGKTVVALHRAAYLLYSDPGLGRRRGGVLVVGPHEPYLDYVSDVLPRIGEEGVRMCTLRDLVPEGATALPESDPEVARLKSTTAMVGAIEPAVRFSERPPTADLLVETPWADVLVRAADWAAAFGSPEPGTPHDEAREVVWEALLDLLVERCEDVPAGDLRRALRRSGELTAAFRRAWPVLDPAEVVADLWSVPAYLRLCAPWLTPDEVRVLQRADPAAWTVADLPLLDAARARIGDPAASRARRRDEAGLAAEHAYRAEVRDELIAAEDDRESLVTMLVQTDLEDALLDRPERGRSRVEALAGPFAHVVVDEAQELTDAEWQMLLRRCPSRSLTVVGDRAQARHGFAESWQDRLCRVGAGDARVATLTLNYRTPEEVMAEAAPVIHVVLPDAAVPTSVRRTGVPVRHGSVADLDAVLDAWLAAHEGTACVIGGPASAARDRVRVLSPADAKGLEFDLVVLVDPVVGAAGDGDRDVVAAAVDRYVAMTRATQELVVLARSVRGS